MTISKILPTKESLSQEDIMLLESEINVDKFGFAFALFMVLVFVVIAIMLRKVWRIAVIFVLCIAFFFFVWGMLYYVQIYTKKKEIQAWIKEIFVCNVDEVFYAGRYVSKIRSADRYFVYKLKYGPLTQVWDLVRISYLPKTSIVFKLEKL